MDKNQMIMPKHLPFVRPVIEDDIPLPSTAGVTRPGRAASPWEDLLKSLKPGQSFVVPRNRFDTVKITARRCSVPIVFRHSTTGLPWERTVRIWRAKEGR